MLIYEKIVNGVRQLFGSATGIPASTDTQVVYKDADGDTITPVPNDTYLDDGKGGIIRKSDDKFVAAFVGNTCVIPNAEWTPAEKVLVSIKVTKKPTKLIYTVGEALDLTGIKVQGTYASGDKEDVTASCTFSPASGATLSTTDTKVTVTCSSKTAEFAITVNAAE